MGMGGLAHGCLGVGFPGMMQILLKDALSCGAILYFSLRIRGGVAFRPSAVGHAFGVGYGLEHGSCILNLGYE
jgi:hypothetical protein